jgi:hypothetical protein
MDSVLFSGFPGVMQCLCKEGLVVESWLLQPKLMFKNRLVTPTCTQSVVQTDKRNCKSNKSIVKEMKGMF